jgi:hypothetical protein
VSLLLYCTLFSSLSGAAKEFDQNCLIHGIWKRLAELGTFAWVERVPTAQNLADLPSRYGSSFT